MLFRIINVLLFHFLSAQFPLSQHRFFTSIVLCNVVVCDAFSPSYTLTFGIDERSSQRSQDLSLLAHTFDSRVPELIQDVARLKAAGEAHAEAIRQHNVRLVSLESPAGRATAAGDGAAGADGGRNSGGGGGGSSGLRIPGGDVALRPIRGDGAPSAALPKAEARPAVDSVVKAVRKPVPMLGKDAALLVICANRAEYLQHTLDTVAKHYPASAGKDGIPVVISQDGDNSAVAAVIRAFGLRASGAVVAHVQHKTEDQTAARGLNAYQKLSVHYKWALEQASRCGLDYRAVFDRLEQDGYNFAATDKVIILEEDLKIAPDFFEYFSALAPLLDADPQLMAVSAWNDNGLAGHVHDHAALFRSDFFPGLGWMMPRRIWDELGPKWPKGYWDDWLREPQQRLGRHFIRPEVCRTFHFGQKGGASANQYSHFLDDILLNQVQIGFRGLDLSYLEPERYEREFMGRVLAAPIISPQEAVSEGARKKPRGAPTMEVRVPYPPGDSGFERVAQVVGAMPNVKAGVPRTAYRGIVTLWVGHLKVHLVPLNLAGS
ncbi:unnamed protein product [Phaeothamnion confervicola]